MPTHTGPGRRLAAALALASALAVMALAPASASAEPTIGFTADCDDPEFRNVVTITGSGFPANAPIRFSAQIVGQPPLVNGSSFTTTAEGTIFAVETNLALPQTAFDFYDDVNRNLRPDAGEELPLAPLTLACPPPCEKPKAHQKDPDKDKCKDKVTTTEP